MKQYKKVGLLILDEWLLTPLKDSQAMDVLEIVETRHQNASTIFCTQFSPGGWHEKIGEETLIVLPIANRPQIRHDIRVS
jgi:DNA replication protein DnaC